MAIPKAYMLTALDKDGNVVRHKEFDPYRYPLSKLRAAFEANLEPLYFGDVETILIQRVGQNGGSS